MGCKDAGKSRRNSNEVKSYKHIKFKASISHITCETGAFFILAILFFISYYFDAFRQISMLPSVKYA